jgi:hypothetical protein
MDLGRFPIRSIQHEVDLMPEEDEEPIEREPDRSEDITGIELDQGPVIDREVAIEEKSLPPPLGDEIVIATVNKDRHEAQLHWKTCCLRRRPILPRQ